MFKEQAISALQVILNRHPEKPGRARVGVNPQNAGTVDPGLVVIRAKLRRETGLLLTM
jgi:hypothetical protein